MVRFRCAPALAGALGGLALLLAGGTPADAGGEDDAFLESIAGVWRGTGRVRTSLDAERERVNCRLEALWDDHDKRLTMDFDCRGIDFKFSTSGFLTSLQRETFVEGQWRGTGRMGQADVFGQREGTAISLTVTSREQRSDEETTSRLTIVLSEEGELVNVVSATDRATRQEYEALELVLRRREASGSSG